MQDEKTLSAAYEVRNNYIPDHIVWERLQLSMMEKLFQELKPGKYYTIRLRRSVEPDYEYRQEQILRYRIDVGLNQVEQQRVRMYTVEDMPNPALMKTAVQEVKSRLRRWARAWWKSQQKEFAPWTWA